MATYKEIKGTQIEAVASDPSNPVEGQVWYNSTSAVVKGSIRTGAAAWATATAMSTTRWGGGASSVSPQSDAIMASGADTANVELYNGTNWTEVNNVNQKRYGMWGTGTSTSMIVFGGNIPGASPTASGDLNSTELWNGTNWTEVNNLNEVKRYPGGAGSSNTNSLCFASFNGTNQDLQQLELVQIIQLHFVQEEMLQVVQMDLQKQKVGMELIGQKLMI